MKRIKALVLLMIALLALASPARATCTTAPLVAGTFDVNTGAPPTTDWIASFFPFSGRPYSMRVWGIAHSGQVSFGAGSGVRVNVGAACVYSACSPFPSAKWTSIFLPGTASSYHTDVIVNDVKVAEWNAAWAHPTSGSTLHITPATFSEGITGISANVGYTYDRSELDITGWNTDATHTYHKGRRIDLQGPCGSVF